MGLQLVDPRGQSLHSVVRQLAENNRKIEQAIAALVGGVGPHTHPISDIVNLQTSLNAKADTASAVMDGDTAGGVLAGTYPNPSFASDMATQAELDTHKTSSDHDSRYYTESEVDALLEIASGIDMQQMINATSAVDLSGSNVEIEAGSLTLPSGWSSFNAYVTGKQQVNNNIATDLRVAVWLESPASTQLNQSGAVSLIATGTYAAEPGMIPLTALLTGLTATQTIRIMGTITGGSTTSGNATAVNRHLMALKIRVT